MSAITFFNNTDMNKYGIWIVNFEQNNLINFRKELFQFSSFSSFFWKPSNIPIKLYILISPFNYENFDFGNGNKEEQT